MDLRSIINSEAGESSASKPATTPVTPGQPGPPSQIFREPSQATLSKHPSQDHGQQAPAPYASPTAYQGGYHGRPSGPPPILPPSQNELRSPADNFQYSGQSPYRHTPSSSVSGGHYSFSQQHTPQSPAGSQAYPPSLQHRESYTQSNAITPQLQHHNSYSQVSPVPQTPPVGPPSNPQSYFHQRSQSSQSNSTPTSAHSQQPYHNSYPQDSPVSASAIPHTQLPQHQRQQSQPGTPLGPPISAARHASGGYAQPTSPYLQRPPSSGAIPQLQRSNTQTSPPPPQNQEVSHVPGVYEPQRRSIGEASRSSHTERERTISVSPKTQLPGLPKTESVAKQQQSNGLQSTKRKMDERETSEGAGQRTPTNGERLPNSDVRTSSPMQPVKKRVRYTEPPIWARSKLGRVKSMHPSGAGTRILNGRPPPQANNNQPAVAIKSEINGHGQYTKLPSYDENAGGLLGPWEPSLTGQHPYDEISGIVSDWLFQYVVNRPDAGELVSRSIEIEIEAKLGQLIDKQTNERYYLPVQSECVLKDTGNVTFRSTMTEAQHKTLNDFLNAKVRETHPQNPNRESSRVPVFYNHRNERDKFYELPASFHSSLPHSIKAQLNPRHTVKVRVTTDEKTGQVLAKIIKGRVADLDIYMPRDPLDCRISINLEMEYDGSIEDLASNSDTHRMPDRGKNRLSYTHSHYQIDLTQVTVSDAKGIISTENELEIELSSAAVREQGRRIKVQEPHKYPELVQGLIDNVRVLTRTVPASTAQLPP